MKIQTLSIVCGTKACNAHCPFCVSKTTPEMDLPTDFNVRNFHKACRLAEIGGATTVLITGKGEPTLYPDLISTYLLFLNDHNIPLIELQTNGIELARLNQRGVRAGRSNSYLQDWHEQGLDTICLSAVHYLQEKNREIYGSTYPEIEKTVAMLHKIGYTVRLSIMMFKEYICTAGYVLSLVKFCKENKVDQLTIRSIKSPSNCPNTVAEWIENNTLDDYEMLRIRELFDADATPVLHLAHGAVVYDWCGQNVCLTDCLTANKSDEQIRQIIYYPTGRISYDWCFEGAILL